VIPTECFEAYDNEASHEKCGEVLICFEYRIPHMPNSKAILLECELVVSIGI
jgi:hypothetical protein